ncbi:MAG: hypothetical protein AABX24_02485, partial [Nanoarchaeota archaeon]
YWLQGEIPLVETEGFGKLSRPVASVVILEATHFVKEGYNYTRGKYEVKAVFDRNDLNIYFEGMQRR